MRILELLCDVSAIRYATHLTYSHFFLKLILYTNTTMKKLLITLALFSATVSFGQRPNTDPRSLKGAVDPKIQTMTDWNSFVQSTNGNSLKKNAVTVAHAPKVEMPALSQGTVSNTTTFTDRSQGLWKIENAPNGTVNWMWRISSKSHAQTSQSIKPKDVDALAILQEYNHTLKLVDPKTELVQMSDSRDEIGMRHVRYAQQFKGLPIWNKDMYIHLDAQNEASVINGTYIPTPKTADVTASINQSTAIENVITDLKAKNIWAPVSADVASLMTLREPTATLALYPEGRNVTLVYDIHVNANLVESYEYLVNAKTGAIIKQLATFCSLSPMDHSKAPITANHVSTVSPTAKPGLILPQAVGFTNCSGTDLLGVNQTLRCYQHSDGKFYSLYDLSNLNIGKSTLPNVMVGGGQLLTLNNKDNGNDLFHVTSSSTTFSDPSGVSASFNIKACYEYYKNTFQRKAIDDKDGVIRAIIHTTEGGESMDNAYYNFGTGAMYYGDGKSTFKPLAGDLDVGAHEMTHGVTQNTAALVYENQSGALNESFSDVFAVMIDDKNLLLGEHIMQPGQGSFLRDMENPANPAGHRPQPDHMNVFKQLENTPQQDNGGVHINSGIPNRACGIIIKALGRDKAQRIYYRALSNYLTRNSQFIDCRHACETAAKDLGFSTTDQQTVSNAFATVGIGTGTTDNGGNNVPSQTGGAEAIAFITGTGKIGVINPSTGVANLFSSEFAVARISNNGFRSQLTAPRNGADIWFVSPQGKLSYIITQTGEVREFPNLNLGQAGDLWNAAVNANESLVAITSAYANDPNIYIFDGNQIVKYPLLVSGGDGNNLSIIQYPDVIAWSPNKNIPRLGLDAYNEEDLGGSPYGYWSMYEFNFESKSTNSLISSLPYGISIGNIAYSSLDPDMIAFNETDGTTSDVVIAKFQDGRIYEQGIFNKTINGNPIFDVGKPTFKPDDAYLSFTSEANNAILFLNVATSGLQFLQFQEPIYNPLWFLIGGSADVKSEEALASVTLKGAYPSIFESDLAITFSNARSMEIKCDLLNVFGETVYHITDGRYEAGEHTLNISQKNIAAGAYFVRLFADGKDQTVKVIKK